MCGTDGQGLWAPPPGGRGGGTTLGLTRTRLKTCLNGALKFQRGPPRCFRPPLRCADRRAPRLHPEAEIGAAGGVRPHGRQEGPRRHQPTAPAMTHPMTAGGRPTDSPHVDSLTAPHGDGAPMPTLRKPAAPVRRSLWPQHNSHAVRMISPRGFSYASDAVVFPRESDLTNTGRPHNSPPPRATEVPIDS